MSMLIGTFVVVLKNPRVIIKVFVTLFISSYNFFFEYGCMSVGSFYFLNSIELYFNAGISLWDNEGYNHVNAQLFSRRSGNKDKLFTTFTFIL